MTNTTQRRTARLARLLAVGAALAGSVLVTATACAPADTQNRQRGDRRAERQTDSAQRAERRIAMLTARLQLSSQQQTQLRQILAEERRQVQALFPDGRRRGDVRGPRRPDDARRERGANRPDSARREEMRATMEKARAIREQTEQRIEGVLTERQRAEYRALREEQRKRFEQRGPRGERGRVGA
jgi:hypothetical protein